MLDSIRYFLAPKVLLPLPEVARQKMERAMSELPIELRRFLAGQYPPFVTAMAPVLTGAEVPVFMFHKVSPAGFEEQLCFLKQNGYRTLSLPEYFDLRAGRFRLKAPAVLLTFDDGDRSLYATAFPLLKKHDLRAVAFVVPGCIERAAERGQGGSWVSWAEMEEMQRSGIIDIQSHSLYHDRIFIGPELLDFCHPHFDATPLRLDMPWLEENGAYTNQLQEGTPLYRYAPSLAGRPRCFHDHSVRRACVEFVAEQGGPDFFRKQAWRRRLGAFYFRRVSRGRPPWFETAEELKTRIFRELRLARQMLEERLNKPVRHLCYPWGRGSELAVTLSRQAGYESNFWVILPEGRQSNPSLFRIPRIKDDYLFRLPGRGRKSLAEIFREKLCRRKRTLDLY